MGAEGGGSYAAFAAAFSVPSGPASMHAGSVPVLLEARNAENLAQVQSQRIHGKRIQPKFCTLLEI